MTPVTRTGQKSQSDEFRNITLPTLRGNNNKGCLAEPTNCSTMPLFSYQVHTFQTLSTPACLFKSFATVPMQVNNTIPHYFHTDVSSELRAHSQSSTTLPTNVPFFIFSYVGCSWSNGRTSIVGAK